MTGEAALCVLSKIKLFPGAQALRCGSAFKEEADVLRGASAVLEITSYVLIFFLLVCLIPKYLFLLIYACVCVCGGGAFMLYS